MPTYHGITKAECLICGYSTTDDETLELWNDGSVPCPSCSPGWGERGASRWEYVDGPPKVCVMYPDTDEPGATALEVFVRSERHRNPDRED